MILKQDPAQLSPYKYVTTGDKFSISTCIMYVLYKYIVFSFMELVQQHRV